MGLYDAPEGGQPYDELTGSDKEKNLARYRGQVSASAKWRKDSYEEDWRGFIDLYANNHFQSSDIDEFADDHEISIGVSFATINIIYPSVSIARPKITVTATHPDLVDAAETVEAVINYWWKHHNFQDEFRRAVKDYLILGHGWLKVTYLFKEQEQPLPDEERMAQFHSQLMEKYTAIQMRPQDAELFPSDEEIADLIPTVKKVVLEDRPQVERVSPFDIFVDPDAPSMAEARWIAQRIAVPVKELDSHKDWSAKARKELKDNKNTKKETEGHYADQKDKGEQYVFVFEHYNLSDNTICTFAMDGTDEFLKPPETIPFTYGHPFVMLRNYDIPEKFYPMGELEVLEPLQLELDLTRSAQLRDLMGHVRKYVSRKGSFDQENIERMATSRDGEMILAEESAPDDITKALFPLPTIDIPQQTYQMSDIIQGDMTRSSGVSDYQMGTMPEIRRTATEAGMIQDSSNARAAEKLAQIELILAFTARRIVQLAQQFLTQEQVARIAGDDGAISWVKFDRETIQGEFDFEIEAGSTQPQNETFRRQSAMQLMDAISSPLFAPQPNPMTGVPEPILDARKVAEHVLRYGFGIKNPQEFLTPAPPPMPPGMPPMVPGAPGMPPGGPPGAPQPPLPGGMPPEGPNEPPEPGTPPA